MPQPTFSSADGYIGERFFTLHFDVALDAANQPPLNAFDARINGSGITITGVTVNAAAKTVTLNFSGSALTAGDIIEFSYSDPTGSNDLQAIQGGDGADAASFSSSVIAMGGRPAPAAPPAPALDVGSDSGALGDNITADKTPTITGTANANATVKLYESDGTTLLGTTTADGSGNWSITTSTLSDGTHALKATQTDSGANTSPLSTPLAVTIDTSAPSITSIAAVGTPAPNATTVNMTVTFSEAVTGVDTGDFTLTGSGTAAANVSSISGSGTTYTVTLDNISGQGTIRLDFNASGTGVGDQAGNGAPGYTTGSLITVDDTAPTVVSIVPDTTGPTNATTLTQTVTFSEAVSGVDTLDFTVSATGTAAATVSSISGSGTTYTVTLTGVSGDGTIGLGLKGSGTGIANGVGNAIAGGAMGGATTIDHTAPSIVSIAPSTAGPTNATTLTQTVTFSEAVTGVDVTDFTLAATGTVAATVSSVTGSGMTYTVTLNGISGDGTIRLNLNGSGTGIADAAGNAVAGGSTGTIATIAQQVTQPEPEPPLPPPTTGSVGDDVLDLRGDELSGLPHTYAGGAGADIVYGGDAGDTLQGNTGDDSIQGGAGDDLILGGQGADRLDAGDGNDLLFGDRGDDSVAGGAGNDSLQGNTGADTIVGGSGDDLVLGGQDRDWLEGGVGGDRLFGDLGNDTVQGNTGADTLMGGAGDDVLLGGKDNDRLDGGEGADVLSGDLGNDTLTGGTGADVFAFAPSGGVDHVTDFHAAEGDRVQLAPGTTYTLAQVGADTVIDLGQGAQMILDNVQLTSLPAGWILA